jgi:hypothetical protein
MSDHAGALVIFQSARLYGLFFTEILNCPPHAAPGPQISFLLSVSRAIVRRMSPEPESPTPISHPILVWALSQKGDMVATYFDNLAEAEYYGQINTDSGAWRTWDAFELPPDLDATRRVLVATHDKSKLVDVPRRARPRILASLSPAAIAAIDAGSSTVHIDVPRAPEAVAAPPPQVEYSPPKHSRVRVLTDWTPLLPPFGKKGAPPPPPRPPRPRAEEADSGSTSPTITPEG